MSTDRAAGSGGTPSSFFMLSPICLRGSAAAFPPALRRPPPEGTAGAGGPRLGGADPARTPLRLPPAPEGPPGTQRLRGPAAAARRGPGGRARNSNAGGGRCDPGGGLGAPPGGARAVRAAASPGLSLGKRLNLRAGPAGGCRPPSGVPVAPGAAFPSVAAGSRAHLWLLDGSGRSCSSRFEARHGEK